MSTHNVFNHGRVYVMRVRCATCIYRPGNLMQLKPGRVEDLAATAVARESVIPCHETLDTEQHAVCNGYWLAHARDVVTLRLARAMQIVSYL